MVEGDQTKWLVIHFLPLPLGERACAKILNVTQEEASTLNKSGELDSRVDATHNNQELVELQALPSIPSQREGG